MSYHFHFIKTRIKKVIKKRKEIYLGDIIINLNKIVNKKKNLFLNLNLINFGYTD